MQDGGTNVNNGLLKALAEFEERETDKRRIIVLICDGDVNYYQPTIDRCIENEIQIYAVNVENSATHSTLQKMADQTNGQYYYGASVSDLTGMLGMIQDDTINKIDPTDTDGDGLYDVYEKKGIKLPSGRIIYTDPTLKDTDGDGLTDFEETGIIYNVDKRYIGNGTYDDVKYFIMRSNPTAKDSDSDGIYDKEDSSPWIADYITKNLYNTHIKNKGKEKGKDVEYLNVGGKDGGDQGWWSERTNFTAQNKLDDFIDYERSADYRMKQYGCGVVAMSDMQLYLMQQNNEHSNIFSEYEIAYDNASGYIEKDDYMEYTEMQRDFAYHLRPTPVNYIFGVLPGDMEEGIKIFFMTHNYNYKSVIWAPYCGGITDTKYEIANKIETMLFKNRPVVFSYCALINEGGEAHEEEINLYGTIENAKEKKLRANSTNSHYMTIIGCSKYLKKDDINYSYILKVVSWGDIYYIDYDEYAEKLSYITNILEIR